MKTIRDFIKIEYTDLGSMKEHIFGDKRVGNCALCGEFVKLDPHHKITQSRGGGEEDEIDVCRKCHNWVNNYPLEASKYGLYIKGYKINE